MALSEPSRHELYDGLSKIMTNEEAIAEVVSHFPAREADEPATKADIALVKADIDLVRTDLKGDIAAVRTDLKADVAAVRAELKADVALVHTGLEVAKADLGASEHRLLTAMREMELRIVDHVHRELRASMYWTIGIMLTLAGVIAAAT